MKILDSPRAQRISIFDNNQCSYFFCSSFKALLNPLFRFSKKAFLNKVGTWYLHSIPNIFIYDEYSKKFEVKENTSKLLLK